MGTTEWVGIGLVFFVMVAYITLLQSALRGGVRRVAILERLLDDIAEGRCTITVKKENGHVREVETRD